MRLLLRITGAQAVAHAVEGVVVAAVVVGPVQHTGTMDVPEVAGGASGDTEVDVGAAVALDGSLLISAASASLCDDLWGWAARRDSEA